MAARRVEMSYIDRVKIAVPLKDVKELKYGAFTHINDGRKHPTHVPVMIVNKKWDVLIIDISIPRSLFNNTLEESSPKEFPKIVGIIQKYAKSYGIYIPSYCITGAAVWYAEFGKNMPLSCKYNMANLLARIGKTLALRKNWLGKVWYFNNQGNTGLKVCVRNQEREICFYDKTTKELVSSGEYNRSNQQVFQKLLEQGYQVLRYEVKFFNHGVMKRVCAKYGQMARFDSIWESGFVEQLLADNWREIEAGIPPASSRKHGLIKSIQTAVLNGVKLKDIMVKFGLDYLERELGSTLLKQVLLPIGIRKRNKSQEATYSDLRKQRRSVNGKFKAKKEYVLQKINQYIGEMMPIRLKPETDYIEGVR